MTRRSAEPLPPARIGLAHLTNPAGGNLPERAAETRPGMAHFAGTGPAGTTCRECLFWGETLTKSLKLAQAFDVEMGKPQRKAAFGRFSGDGSLKPQRCEKFRRMTMTQTGDKIEHCTKSCKYFDPNPNAPAVSKPERHS